MSTKFFTNASGNSLFDKLKGISDNMPNFDLFCAAVGYFRASGYFKIRKELANVSEIRVLVGINIDKLFAKHQSNASKQGNLFTTNPDDVRKQYINEFIQDVKDAGYSAEIEDGIIQLAEDLKSGRLKMKAHPDHNLHAKFYLCLPKNYNENTDGWVIMGSSNLSEQGLGLTQPPRYELNVAMKDFDDVNFCREEFDKLWKEGVDIRPEDADNATSQTHLALVTPYELYMKLLIEWFGELVEDDFTIDMPDGYKDLKYQQDAASQGFQLMMKHNGFILADVVGLGKTIVAAIIARRFREVNGNYTNILVVCPPAVRQGWEKTFKSFGLRKRTHYITSGSLDKVINAKDNYYDKEDYDLIIVDEAHNYRRDESDRFQNLQTICKSPCEARTNNRNSRKKVILISATPLNNHPEDIKNLLSLFQDTKCSTLDGIANLDRYFAKIFKDYGEIMRQRDQFSPEELTERIEDIYSDVRQRILDQITVRRTRHNILNNPEYKTDLDNNNIHFPDILPPNEWRYQLNSKLVDLFEYTVDVLTNEETGLDYTRYRAIEHLKAPYNSKFSEAKQSAKNLANIYKINMVKRLESSFYAFKRSLATFIKITGGLIEMYNNNTVAIVGSRDSTLRKLQNDGLELNEILDILIAKEKGEIFPREAFDDDFIVKLQNDYNLLLDLNERWAHVTEDPKIDLFIEKLNHVLFDPSRNQSDKLVVFSESVDTVNYLTEQLQSRFPQKRVISITSKTRDDRTPIVEANFDANLPETEQNHDPDKEYNILISSDVLSEGVNLHRAHLIVNYDSPWNATRLMQRIGRVNRIGSVSDAIYNYMFYPSDEGDHLIRLISNAIIKLQGFHSALGEDAQIFSHEEIVRQFELFNRNVKDDIDENIAFLREARELYRKHRDDYHRIKALPPKSRVARLSNKNHPAQTTVAYIASDLKTQCYRVTNGDCSPIQFAEAARLMKAKPDEQALNFVDARPLNIAHIGRALNDYQTSCETDCDTGSANANINDPEAQKANKQLREWKRAYPDCAQACDTLMQLVSNGTISALPQKIAKIKKEADKQPSFDLKNLTLTKQLKALCTTYTTSKIHDDDPVDTHPEIVLSETFI